MESSSISKPKSSVSDEATSKRSSSSPASSTKSSKPKKRKRTEPGKPVRARSAYNFFYQYQRVILLKSLNDPNDPTTTEETIDQELKEREELEKSGKEIFIEAQTLEQKMAVKHRLRIETDVLIGNKEAKRRKRVHRKTPGMIELKNLTRLVAFRWKHACEATREFFESQAHEDTIRYKGEMKVYNANKQKKASATNGKVQVVEKAENRELSLKMSSASASLRKPEVQTPNRALDQNVSTPLSANVNVDANGAFSLSLLSGYQEKRGEPSIHPMPPMSYLMDRKATNMSLSNHPGQQGFQGLKGLQEVQGAFMEHFSMTPDFRLQEMTRGNQNTVLNQQLYDQDHSTAVDQRRSQGNPIIPVLKVLPQSETPVTCDVERNFASNSISQRISSEGSSEVRSSNFLIPAHLIRARSMSMPSWYRKEWYLKDGLLGSLPP